MNLKALLTSLVLASSSVAVADPLVQFKIDPDRSLRDQRGMWRPTWAPVSNTILARSRVMIDVNDQRDDLSAIRLQNVTGATYIYGMTLVYKDGHRENLTVSKWLYSGQPMLTFDLKLNRNLDKIMLRTWTYERSTLQVYGKQMRRIVRPPIVVEPPPPPLPPQPVYFVAGKDLTFANSPGYVHLAIGADKGRFDKLVVEATGASTFIGHIHVTFGNGQHQTLNVDKTLYRGQTLEFALDGKGERAIASLTVMQSHDVRQIGPSAGRFNIVLK